MPSGHTSIKTWELFKEPYERSQKDKQKYDAIEHTIGRRVWNRNCSGAWCALGEMLVLRETKKKKYKHADAAG